MTKQAKRVRVWSSLVDGWDPVAFQRAREAAGLTFDEIAARMKGPDGRSMARSSVRAWSEYGRPRTDKLKRLARILGVNPEDLTK